MKVKELVKLLERIPAEAEIVVGDPHYGMFWNPVLSKQPALTGWKVTEDWAQQQIRTVNFFALFPQEEGEAQSSQQHVDANGRIEVRALCL